MRSIVWSNVDRRVLATHNQTATWVTDPECRLYRYTHGYGMEGCRHPGVDIDLPHGTPVFAIGAGRVTWIRPEDSGMREVRVTTPEGHEHLYTHLSSASCKHGDAIRPGDPIGHSGTSGSPHLHFELRIPDDRTTMKMRIVDPVPLLTGGTEEEPMPTYDPSNPIAGDSRGSPQAWMAFYASRSSTLRPTEVAAYVNTVYEFAPKAGLGAHKIVTQAHHETDGFTSYWWQTRLNPAGIGVTGDSAQDQDSPTFGSGREAALAHLIRVCYYVFGAIPSALVPYVQVNPRPVPTAAWGKRTTLESFGHPDWRTYPTWATDATYGAKWARTLNDLEHVFKDGLIPATPGDGTGGATPPEEPAVSTHAVIISYGHRNDDRGGATREFEWTPLMGKRLQRAFLRRGWRADVIQENDGGTDPTLSAGGLQSVARRCVELAKTRGPYKAYISCHYEGASAGSRGFFGIVADARSGVDTKANNTLDVTFIEAMAREVKKTGMPLRKLAGHPTAGLMSERETNVGSKGHRLGEFVGTIGFRDTTVRTIIEAGNYVNTSDRKLLWDLDGWVERYCEAIVDAAEAVFGKPAGAQPQPEPPQVPVPLPPDPKPIVEIVPGLSVELAKRLFGSAEANGKTYAFDPKGPVSQLWIEHGKKVDAWPTLKEVAIEGETMWFVFHDGLVIWKPSNQSAVEILGADRPTG